MAEYVVFFRLQLKTLFFCLLLTACAGTSEPIISSNASSQSSQGSQASLANTVTFPVRVEGLKLGQVIQLNNVSLKIDKNGVQEITAKVPVGTAISPEIIQQPKDQLCEISGVEQALSAADKPPVLISCMHTPSASVTMPETQPVQPLKVAFDWRGTAYPNTLYDSRPGVVGGIFPYEFRIKAFTINGVPQPTSGLKVDFRRGTLHFTPVNEGDYAFTFEVRDSGQPPKVINYTTHVDVKASAFIFVAPEGLDEAGQGTRDAPFKTLKFAIANSTAKQVIYLRKGTYAADGIKLLDNKSKQLLAYENEPVVLDMNKAGNLMVNSDILPMARIEGVTFINVVQYGIISDPSKAGLVIRKVHFLNGQEGPVLRENPAFIHSWGDTSSNTRHKMLIQENIFGTYTGFGYATTLFDVGDSIIENNQLNLGKVNGGFHDKDNSQNNVYRENYIEFSEANRNGNGILISAQGNSENIHIHHNLLINAGIFIGGQCLKETCTMINHDVHYNTLVNGQVGLNFGPFNPESAGTRLSHNIIVSRSLAPYKGLSCQERPPKLDSQLFAANNLMETTNALAFKDSECGGNDMSWAVWQEQYKMDTNGSGSIYKPSIGLIGAGPTTGFLGTDLRLRKYGHQF